MIWRVRDRATFVALRRQGHRAHQGPITVAWLPSDQPGPPRVAYAVGRRVGGAVTRNRLRRRLRAAAGDLAPELAPGAYLIGAAAEASGLSYAALRDVLAGAIRAVEARRHGGRA